jgi:hypothetical protein
MSTLTVDDVIDLIQESKGDPPDFLERHGALLLTIIGVCTGCFGTLLVYFLKSRCKKLKFGCIECDRDVLALDPKDVEVTSSSAEQAP